jgi:hypothetical protein
MFVTLLVWGVVLRVTRLHGGEGSAAIKSPAPRVTDSFYVKINSHKRPKKNQPRKIDPETCDQMNKLRHISDYFATNMR